MLTRPPSQLGVPDGQLRFLTTGIHGIVKFTMTFSFSVFIIDFVGRRHWLFTGICLQIVTSTSYLGVTNSLSESQIAANTNLERASTAAIFAIFLHAVSESIGWFSMPYLVNCEIFPTRIQSFNMSLYMALHWAWYFACSKAMPNLLAATNNSGAFVFFASICVCSLVFAFFCLPETAGRSLESHDSLFPRPLYTIWKVAYPTEAEVLQEGVVTGEKADAMDSLYVERTDVESPKRDVA